MRFLHFCVIISTIKLQFMLLLFKEKRPMEPLDQREELWRLNKAKAPAALDAPSDIHAAAQGAVYSYLRGAPVGVQKLFGFEEHYLVSHVAFALLAERERCAKIAEGRANYDPNQSGFAEVNNGRNDAARKIAAAIRG